MTTIDFKPKQRADRDVISFCEFSGLRNDIAPERLTNNDLVAAVNVTIDNARAIRRRAGSTLRKAGAAHSLWSHGGDALMCFGTELHRIDTTTLATTKIGATSGAKVSFATAGDNVYYSDGASRGVALATGTRTWGLDVPAFTATRVAGDLAAGRYHVAATYVRNDGQESGAGAAAMYPAVAGDSLLVNVVPSADATVTGVRIYVSPPNGEVLYLTKELVGNGGTYTILAADVAAASVPLETEFMGPPPAGQLVAYYKGRMFVAVGDVLYPSEPFNYELFDLRNYIQLDAPITLLAPIEDVGMAGFFIGTSKSMGVLQGENPAEFQYARRTDYGAVQGALAYVDGSIFMAGSTNARRVPLWLSTKGICAGMPSMDITNITRERYTFVADTTGAAMYDPNTDSFIGTLAGGAAVVMNTQVLVLTTFDSYGYNSFAHVNGHNLAASGAGLFELAGSTDNGAPINATVTLPITDFGTSYLKAVDRVYAGYRSSVDMAMDVMVDDARAGTYPLPAVGVGIDTQRVKLGRGLSGRYWQFTVRNTGGADFSLDTIDVKTSRLERRINGRA